MLAFTGNVHSMFEMSGCDWSVVVAGVMASHLGCNASTADPGMVAITDSAMVDVMPCGGRTLLGTKICPRVSYDHMVKSFPRVVIESEESVGSIIW